MFRNVLIKSVDKYLPSKMLDNQYFNEYFSKRGIKTESLYKAVGRDKRFVIDENTENTFTMGIEASKNVLSKSGVDAKEIDMLVFVSDTPEFLAPTTALALHKALNTENADVVFDMNQNCAGMVAALDVVSRYMKTNKRLKKALLVGAFSGSLLANREDPTTYGCLSDGASAVILEAVEEEKKRGVIDSSMVTGSFEYEKMVFPAKGLSNMHKEDLPIEAKKLYWGHGDVDYLETETVRCINKLLHNNSVTPQEVEHYIVSQFEPGITKYVSEEYGVPLERFTMSMAECGYVGNSSPILTLDKLINEGIIKEGDNLIISTIASGYTVTALLYQF